MGVLCDGSTKAAFTLLRPDEQEAIRVSARVRFLLYALIKTSNSKHDKIKDDLSDDYTKGSDNYPDQVTGIDVDGSLFQDSNCHHNLGGRGVSSE